ncbi:MAG: hypothetical protein AAF742_05580, partial [Pseudomonadota bacterium]
VTGQLGYLPCSDSFFPYLIGIIRVYSDKSSVNVDEFKRVSQLSILIGARGYPCRRPLRSDAHHRAWIRAVDRDLGPIIKPDIG